MSKRFSPYAWFKKTRILQNLEVSKTVRDYLIAGKKVNAIKEHRRTTGLGLKESKIIVDQACQQLLDAGLVDNIYAIKE